MGDSPLVKPDIVGVIGARVDLRRAGRELVGLCPFHDDRHPSFSVNPDKGVFHCFGCGASGDVINFVMRADGLTFPAACKALQCGSDHRPHIRLTAKRKQAAELAAAWVNEQRAKIGFLIGERLEERDLADESGAFDIDEMFDRELVMLREFYDVLRYPRGAVEMLALQQSIEQITEGAELAL